MKNFWLTLTQKKKLSLIVIVLLLVLFTVLAIAWVIKANYLKLGDISRSDQVNLITKFDESGIGYQVTNDGQLLVKEDEYAKSKAIIEEQGNTKYPSKGLELFDNTDYSMTDYAQKVTMKRAIQGELERTLSALSFTKFARVHLTLEDKKLFSKNKSPAKAAVTIFTHNHSVLSFDQIKGVQNLVASSVDGLNAAKVTVFDEDGIKISDTINQQSEKTFFNGNKDLQEKKLTEKVEKLLNLYFEPEQFAVSISLKVNNNEKVAVINELITNKNGEGAVITKKSSVKSPKASSSKVSGLSNNETLEIKYSHGSKTEEIKVMAGEITLISAAVALMADLSAADIAKVKSVVSAAVGANFDRGDVITIESFSPRKPLPLKPTENINIIKQPDILKEEILQNKNDTSGNNQVYYLIIVLLLILVCVTAFKRKSLPLKEKEQILLEVNEWLSKDNNYAK